MYGLGEIIRKHVTEGRLTAEHGRLSGPILSDPKDGLYKTMLLSESEGKRPWRHREILEEKRGVARQISIPHLFESLLGSIHTKCRDPHVFQSEVTALFSSAADKIRLGVKLEEAEILANAFQLLTQAKLFTTMTATYTLTPAVYESLFGSFDSPYEKYDHQIPSDAPELDYVPMGSEYPTGGMTDRFCQTKAFVFGRIIELNRMTFLGDRTGIVVQQSEGISASAKYREDELAVLAWEDSSNVSLVTQQANADAGSYFPEQVQKALWRTAAVTTGTQQNYQKAINKTAANPLRQWDSIQTAFLLLKKMQNVAGQDIDVMAGGPLKVVVPQALTFRARLAVNPLSMHQTDANVSGGAESFLTRTPDAIRIATGVDMIEVIEWRKLTENVTPDNSTWYLAGDSTKQFRRHVVWPVEFLRATPAQQGHNEFKRDVVLSFRAGFNAGFRSVDDKYVVQSPGA